MYKHIVSQVYRDEKRVRERESEIEKKTKNFVFKKMPQAHN